MINLKLFTLWDKITKACSYLTSERFLYGQKSTLGHEEPYVPPAPQPAAPPPKASIFHDAEAYDLEVIVETFDGGRFRYLHDQLLYWSKPCKYWSGGLQRIGGNNMENRTIPSNGFYGLGVWSIPVSAIKLVHHNIIVRPVRVEEKP